MNAKKQTWINILAFFDQSERAKSDIHLLFVGFILIQIMFKNILRTLKA